MVILKGPSGYSIGLINETQFDPDSNDNAVVYDRFYAEKPYKDYHFPIRHGIFLLKDDEIARSACICASGGHTGIHTECSILDGNHFLMCCADSIFCLSLPGLELNWVTIADAATCFGIYNYGEGYIVHGELEISRLDENGRLVWQFSGPDIFTTPAGVGDFTLNGGVIKAISWDGSTFMIDAQTGKTING